MNIFGRLIELEHPEFLYWSWVPVLLVAAGCGLAFYLERALQKAYANTDNLKRTTRLQTLAGLVSKTLGWSLAALLVMAALSQPYEKNRAVSVPQGSLHVVGAFDVSLSMAAEDYRFVLPTEHGGPPVGPWGNRLQTAKWTFTEQVFKAIPGNKVGLVTYTAVGFPQAPLCEDYSTLRYMMHDTNWMGILSAPGGGSDYVQGLRTCIHILRRDFEPGKRNVIMIFSDGGAPDFKEEEEKQEWQKELTETLDELDALRKMANGNLEVIVVGVGGNTDQQIPIYDPRTMERFDWFPLDSEEKAKTKLDESGLKELATKVGGNYVWLNTDGNTRVPIDWAAVIGGQRTVQGKLPLARFPLMAALIVVFAMIARGIFRPSNQIVLPTQPVRG